MPSLKHRFSHCYSTPSEKYSGPTTAVLPHPVRHPYPLHGTDTVSQVSASADPTHFALLEETQPHDVSLVPFAPAVSPSVVA